MLSTFELQKYHYFILVPDLPLFLLCLVFWIFWRIVTFQDFFDIFFHNPWYESSNLEHSFCWHIQFLCSFHRGLMLLIWETAGLWLSVMVAPYSGLLCSNMISISPISWNVAAIVIYLVLVRYECVITSQILFFNMYFPFLQL
jgi:hypothetical protein